MKPIGVILDFDKQSVEYVTPGKAAKAGTSSKAVRVGASGKLPPAKPSK